MKKRLIALFLSVMMIVGMISFGTLSVSASEFPVIYVGGEKITEDNMQDVFNDGTVSFSGGVLKLNGLHLPKGQYYKLPAPVPQNEVASESGKVNAYAYIYAAGDLTVELVSSSIIAMESSTSTDTSGDEYGIYCGGKLVTYGAGALEFQVSADGGSGSAVSTKDKEESGWAASHDAKALIYARDSVQIQSGSYSNTGLPWSAIRSRNITVNGGTFDFRTYGHCIYSENFGGSQELLDEKIALTINGGKFTLTDDRKNPTYNSTMGLGMYALFGQKEVFINGGEIDITSHNGICGDRVEIKGSSTRVNITNNEAASHHVSTTDIGILAEWSWVKMTDGCTVGIDMVQRDNRTKPGVNIRLQGGAVTYHDKEKTGLTLTGSTLCLNSSAVTAILETEKNVPCEPAYTSPEAAVAAAKDGDTVLLLDDVTCGRLETGDKDLTIKPEGKNVTVTLTAPILLGVNNGTRNYTFSGNGDYTLTVRPMLTGGVNSFRPIAIRQGNTLNLESGVILSGSIFNGTGGGMIQVAKDSVLNLNGAVIQNCGAESAEYDTANSHLGRGGAIYVEKGGLFRMNAGEIRNCHATVAGGAVFAVGRMEMNGGKITGCTVTGLDDKGTVKAKGGAVYLYSGSEFAMNGGEISGNTLQDVTEMSGAGVYAAADANVTLGGTAVIDGNTDGKQKKSNLFLRENVIAAAGTGADVPSSGMTVGISVKTAPTLAQPVTVVSGITEEMAAYFAADNTVGYALVFNTDRMELKIDPALIPAANTGLVYNGQVQTGVAAGKGYTVTDGQKSGAGTYTATATLAEGYVWEDDTTAPKQIVWSIAKRTGIAAPSAKVSSAERSLTVTAAGACEYRINGGAWQDSSTFDGLKPDTAYTVEVRVKANANEEASAITTLNARTDKTVAQKIATPILKTLTKAITVVAQAIVKISWLFR